MQTTVVVIAALVPYSNSNLILNARLHRSTGDQATPFGLRRVVGLLRAWFPKQQRCLTFWFCLVVIWYVAPILNALLFGCLHLRASLLCPQVVCLHKTGTGYHYCYPLRMVTLGVETDIRCVSGHGLRCCRLSWHKRCALFCTRWHKFMMN